MCDEFEWDSDDFQMRRARRKFKSAMVQRFNDLYGTDEEDLPSWQNLCHVLMIDPAPEGLKKCHEVRIRLVNFFLDIELKDGKSAGCSDTREPC